MRKDLSTFEEFVALTPTDGRYRNYTAKLTNYLSEAALNRERIYVEIQWVIALCLGLPQAGFASGTDGDGRIPAVPNLPYLTPEIREELLQIVDDFDANSIKELSEIESKTQHDIKAIEYYIKRRLEFLRDKSALNADQFDKLFQAVHIFCTSEDINNLSYALCIKKAVQELWLPKVEALVEILRDMAKVNLETPMLAKTHGQPATPVTLGKELAVFVHRLERQIKQIKQQEYLGKINGATGTFGAHFVSVPTTNWQVFAKHFVEEYLGLTYNPLTTQIESHDWQAELYSKMSHVNRILHNFATDIWTYISNEVFVQIPVEGATGSSTMPHKINPIKFENAEANLEISDALLSKISETLVTSRMQRDLTDSTTQRNVGVAFAHSLLAIENLTQGVQKLKVNEQHLRDELAQNPAVLSEAVQSVMRATGIAGVPEMENPYERLKDYTRGNEITFEGMQDFIKSLGLPEATEKALLELTPEKYVGLSAEVAKAALGV